MSILDGNGIEQSFLQEHHAWIQMENKIPSGVFADSDAVDMQDIDNVLRRLSAEREMLIRVRDEALELRKKIAIPVEQQGRLRMTIRHNELHLNW